MMRVTFARLLVCALLASLGIGARGDDASVPTSAEQCIGPFTGLPTIGSIPRICARIGFAQCSSLALNITVTADGAAIFTREEPTPLDFHYDYPLSDGPYGCVARVTLSKNDVQTITPTYVHVRPNVAVRCAGIPVSSQPLDWITLVSAWQCSG
jgi:hypothetical protein